MSIPTDEEFEKASAAMRARMRDAAVLQQRLLTKLKLLGPMTELTAFKRTDAVWEIYCFVATEAELKRAVERGFLERGPELSKEVIAAVTGSATESVRLLFEIDSLEYVQRKFGHMHNRLNSESRAEYSRICDGFFEAAGKKAQ